MTTDGASPYATGGGGVRLEHRYAATLLAAVLAGDPLAEFGDRATPTLVRLQASDICPVDDVVVEGRTPKGQARRVSVGVRHEPALTARDLKSVSLIRSFLRVVTDHWDEVAKALVGGVGRGRVDGGRAADDGAGVDRGAGPLGS